MRLRLIGPGGEHDVLVDDEDWPWLAGYRWYVVKDGRQFYAYANVLGGGATVKMHRLVMERMVSDEIRGISVDHRNRNGLDNRRENLRLATAREQQHNQGSRPGSSSFKGVYWHAGPGNRVPRWRAMIRLPDGRRKSLGYFDEEADAARAYDAEARAVHGEFALLNFP